MNGPLLEITDLKTHFFTSAGIVRAVEGVGFSISKGGKLGIVGESGSGKSVTALSILRLVSPPGRIVSGSVRFEGEDLLTLSEAEMRKIRGGKIAMVFQEPSTSLNPVMTIGAQIEEAIFFHQRGLGEKERKEGVLDSLTKVRISDPHRVAQSYPHELSGGMKQRTMIAMALSSRPALLIADEPTTALDVTVQAQVLDLLLQLQEELQMALILISHDMGIIAEVAEKILVMQQGRVVESGDVQQIFASPQHSYTQKLLGVYEKFA